MRFLILKMGKCTRSWSKTTKMRSWLRIRIQTSRFHLHNVSKTSSTLVKAGKIITLSNRDNSSYKSYDKKCSSTAKCARSRSSATSPPPFTTSKSCNSFAYTNQFTCRWTRITGTIWNCLTNNSSCFKNKVLCKKSRIKWCRLTITGRCLWYRCKISWTTRRLDSTFSGIRMTKSNCISASNN